MFVYLMVIHFLAELILIWTQININVLFTENAPLPVKQEVCWQRMILGNVTVFNM